MLRIDADSRLRAEPDSSLRAEASPRLVGQPSEDAGEGEAAISPEAIDDDSIDESIEVSGLDGLESSPPSAVLVDDDSQSVQTDAQAAAERDSATLNRSGGSSVREMGRKLGSARDRRADRSGDLSGVVKRVSKRSSRGGLWKQIGRFEIVRQIGSGAFGFVYEGRDIELDRRVAIKIARVEVARHEPLRRLFEQEAEQASRLDHPGIVPVYELGFTDPLTDPEEFSRPYIVMGFCQGQTLDEWMKAHRTRTGGSVPPGLAAELTKQVAASVGHGHRKGVSHRDVKPGNVMVLESGPAAGSSDRTAPDAVPMLRVMDFGLSGDLEQLTQQNGRRLVAGSAAYMSPEQASGDPAGPESDVHALGAVLFKLLTGRTPYSEGDGRTRLLDRLSRTTAPSPRQIDPTVPEDLAAICLKCLRKNPLERYSDATDLADDLDRYLAGQPVRARTLSTWEEFRRWTALPDRIREAGAILVGVHLFLPIWSLGGEIGVYLVDQSDTTTTQQFIKMFAYLCGITWPLHLAYGSVAWRMFRGRPVRWAMRIAAVLALVILSLHFLRGIGVLPSPSPYYEANPGTRWQVFWMLSLTATLDFAALMVALRALRHTRRFESDRRMT